MVNLTDLLKAKRELCYSKVDETLAEKSAEIVDSIDTNRVIDEMNSMLGMSLASAVADRMANNAS